MVKFPLTALQCKGLMHDLHRASYAFSDVCGCAGGGIACLLAPTTCGCRWRGRSVSQGIQNLLQGPQGKGMMMNLGGGLENK